MVEIRLPSAQSAIDNSNPAVGNQRQDCVRRLGVLSVAGYSRWSRTSTGTAIGFGATPPMLSIRC
jgi:hypothetical protein